MDSNFSLSFELVCLMDWLLKNGDQQMVDLIKFAINNGFAAELEKIDDKKYAQITDQLPSIILEFLLTLEDILFESLEKVELDTKSKEKLIPAIKKIDTHSIDFKTIWLSMQQTKSSLVKDNTKKATKETKAKNAKRILFEKLLKNWDPTQNEPLN